MDLKRRGFLAAVGTLSANTVLTGATSATPDKPVRSITPSVADFEGVESVEVEFYENGTIHIQMSGSTKSASTPFSVKPTDVYDQAGRYRPEHADAKIQTPTRKSGRPPNASDGEEETQPTSSVGTASHSGSDNENDYEGGMYCTSKDPVNLAVCATDQWLKWGGSAGNLYWTARKYKWTTWDYKETTWEKTDAGFDGGVDISHYFVTTNAYGDYHNWNWMDDDQKTTAHHRLRLSGASPGYIDWGSDHWHTGEDAGNLWAEVGPHSKYP